MRQILKVGLVTTYSGRWPADLPNNRLQSYGEWLRRELGDAAVIYPQCATTMQEIEKAVSLFRQKEVDCVIMLYGAFTGDDFPCALADQLRIPIILWAPKEPAFAREDRLYANALVALTMNSAALRRMGYSCHALYGGKEDSKAVDKLRGWLQAYSVIKRMRHTLLGLFGYRPTAFYNSAFDEALIRRVFGIRIEETDLKAVFDAMAGLPIDQVETAMRQLDEKYDASALPDRHLENHVRLYFALQNVMHQAGYDYASIKCWPEMGNLKTTPCAVLGRLADENHLIACEGDVDAALAMVVQHILTDEPAFITDMINMDEQANTLTFWHCGNAAPSLYDKKDGLELRNHPLAGQGSAWYGSLKSGTVTIARFCNINGTYKLFLQKGEAVPTIRNTKGTMVNVHVFSPVRDVLQTILDEGVAHHYSIVWQDVAQQMRLICELLGIAVIEP